MSLPSSVTSIGNWAFASCTSLTSVTIPSGVTSIGDGAFAGCTSLTSVAIPSSVTSIGGGAFASCSGLTSIHVSEGNREYRDIDGVLYDYALTELVACPSGVTECPDIPSGVTSIGDGAFVDCTSLTSVTIPEGVTSIGYSAFEGCTGLTSITIPSSVTSIGNGAFASCTSLTSVTIPSGVTSIGNGAFAGCTSLTSIIIPSGVTSIGDGAFVDCTSLTSVSIPSGVTSIGYWAFSGCTGLASITIPSSVTSIESAAFSGCTGLASIHVSEGNGKYRDIDGVLYDYALTELVAWPSGVTECPGLPSSVTSIGDHAFSGCTSLASVAIPSGVTSIGERAFEDCTSLTSVTIPSGVTYIRGSAFSGCRGIAFVKTPGCFEMRCTFPDSLRSIAEVIIVEGEEKICEGFASGCSALSSLTLPESLKTIGDYAFRDCTSLTSITIPSSVTSIGERAFEDCTSLTSVTIPSGVTSIGGGAFSGCNSIAFVKTPVRFMMRDVFRDSFRSIAEVVIAEGGKEIREGFASGCSALTSLTLPESLKTIGREAFKDCTSLTSITIPSGVNSIGYSAFEDCTSLTSITIPSGVTSIEWNAFRGCTGLTSVTISEGVTSIGYSAFEDCTSLTSVTIPEGVTSIDEGAFRGCTSLTSVAIPSGVTSIGGWAFDGCTSLTSIVIPSSVTSIGGWAFDGCTSLTSIVIPSSVTSIGGGAFDGCTSLASIVIPSSVTSIGSEAFAGCTSLASIVIPSGVTSIGSEAFAGCTSLTSIIIPSGVTSIGYGAFAGCSALETLYFPGTPDDAMSWIAFMPAVTLHVFSDQGWREELDEDGTFFGLPVVIGGMANLALTADFDRLDCMAGRSEIRIATNAAWTAESNVPWLRLAKTSGIGSTTLEFEFDENAGPTERAGAVFVRLTDYGLNKPIGVVQERFQFAEGEMKYVVEDGIAVVTGCRPEGSAIIVPGILGGRPVGRIEDGAFARAGQVTSLVFQGTVPEYAGEGRLLDAPGAAITAFRSNEAIDYGWDGVTVFGGLPVTLAAQATSEDGEWIYCVNADGEAQLQRYQGSRLTVDVPAQVAGHRVAGVWGCSRRQNGAYDILGAFTGNAYVRQITVPDDVADLYAGFSGCASLKNILFLGRPPKVTGSGTLFPAKGARINAFEGNGWEDILEENGTFHGTDVTLHPDPVSQGTVASGDFDGGEMLISIAALDAWSIEGLPEWVRASMTSGTGNATVKLEFRENPDAAPRHALLRVLLGCGLADNVAISQAGQVPRRLTCVNATSDVTSAIKGTAATLKIVMPAGEDAANLQIAWEASTECGLTVSPDKLSATVTIPASDLTVSARFLRRIELEEGWNLLCVSRELDEEALAQLDDIGVSAVRDMAIAQVPASSLARGEGFWLWSDGEREIWLKFSDADADETKDDVLSSVETCLVGLPDSRCAAEQSVPDGLTLWEYEDNGWKQVPVAPDGRATLVPYKSYMVLGK